MMILRKKKREKKKKEQIRNDLSTWYRAPFFVKDLIVSPLELYTHRERICGAAEWPIKQDKVKNYIVFGNP